MILLVKKATQSKRFIWLFSDYGNEEEVADFDVGIREPEKENESNIKSELENRREHFRASEKLVLKT